jgi:hypothetical protein
MQSDLATLVLWTLLEVNTLEITAAESAKRIGSTEPGVNLISHELAQ